MEMSSYWIVLRSYSVGCRSYRRPNSAEKFYFVVFRATKRRLVNRHWFIEPCQTIFNRTSHFVKDKLLQFSQLGRETSLADLRWGIGGEQTRYCNLSTRIRFRQLDMPPCMGLSNVSSRSFNCAHHVQYLLSTSRIYRGGFADAYLVSFPLNNKNQESRREKVEKQGMN
jgi:hypothetical protein